VTSAVVALVLCSVGFWWLRTQNSLVAASKLASEHQVAPAPLPPLAPQIDSASQLNAPRPTADGIETTTNAAVTPPVEAVLPIAVPTAGKPRAGAISRRAVRAPFARDKHNAVETASASPKQPTLPGDWDERLSNSPEHTPGASATPAGRLDQHDFR
jgi:hypothetical protein